MDTITHGIAGALISKAAFGGRDLFPSTAMDKRRLATWALMLGSIFQTPTFSVISFLAISCS